MSFGCISRICDVETIKKLMMDSTPAGEDQRKTAFKLATGARVIAVIGAATTIAGLICVVKVVANPIITCIGLLIAGATLLGCFDGYIISSNFQEIVDSSGKIVENFRNMEGMTSGDGTVSITYLVNQLLKNTLFVDRFFKDRIISEFA